MKSSEAITNQRYRFRLDPLRRWFSRPGASSLKLLLSCLLVLAVAFQAGSQPIKVACVGDSITEGGGLVDSPLTNAYPIVLGRMLGANYQTRNFGVSGRTLLKKGDFPYWKDPAFRNATNYAPNIVTIMLGTNDSKDFNWRYRDEFAPDLRELIEVFANLPSHPRILLCLPVPAYAAQISISPDVIKNEVIPIIKQVAKEKGVTTVDLYTPLSGRPDLFSDQIHPNIAGAVLIAKTLHGALRGAP